MRKDTSFVLLVIFRLPIHPVKWMRKIKVILKMISKVDGEFFWMLIPKDFSLMTIKYLFIDDESEGRIGDIPLTTSPLNTILSVLFNVLLWKKKIRLCITLNCCFYSSSFKCSYEWNLVISYLCIIRNLNFRIVLMVARLDFVASYCK